MEYIINVSVPDELVALAKILDNSEVAAMVKDLGLAAKSVTYVPEPPVEPPVERPKKLRISAKEFSDSAKLAARTAEGRDEAKDFLTSKGVRNFKETPEELWPEVYEKMIEIAEKYKDHA